jgi:1-deoxy-D-xylulose-5-phosphate synthase
MEENVMSGGFGEHVCQLVSELQLPVKVLNISLPDDYVEHGSVDILRAEEGIDADTVTERVASFYESSLL